MKTTGTPIFGYGDYCRAWVEGPRYENFEQYCEVTFTNVLEQYFDLNFRGQNSPLGIQPDTSQNGFTFETSPADPNVWITRTDAGTQTVVLSTAFSKSAGVPYGIRQTCYGPYIECKIWVLANGEPSATVLLWNDYLHFQAQDRSTFGPGVLGGASQGFDLTVANYSLKQIRRRLLVVSAPAGGNNYVENLTTVCTSSTSVVDQLAMVESLTTTATATTSETDLTAMFETPTTTATATTSDVDRADFADSLTTTATATTSAVDRADFNDSLQTTAAATTGVTDTLAMFEVVQTNALATTSEVEQLSLFEFLTTTATATTTDSDRADYNEVLTTTATATTSETDVLNNNPDPGPSRTYFGSFLINKS